MSRISEKPSDYWEGTRVTMIFGVTSLAIAIPLGVLCAFTSGPAIMVPASFCGMFGLPGILFLVDAVVAKGHRFQEIRSAVKKILPQGEHILNDDL